MANRCQNNRRENDLTQDDCAQNNHVKMTGAKTMAQKFEQLSAKMYACSLLWYFGINFLSMFFSFDFLQDKFGIGNI